MLVAPWCHNPASAGAVRQLSESLYPMNSLTRLLRPLRRRDFALLTGGGAVSFLGDGAATVALAFQVYQLSNLPTALSLVSLAVTLPTVALLLVGGVISDHVDRRRLMAAADLLRALVTASVAALSLSGTLQLWHLFVLLPFFGAGTALFNPAAAAILPELVPSEDLAQANALNGAAWPLTLLFLGPALGGVLVATGGPGTAFLFDAVTFLVSATSVSLIRRSISASRRQSVRHTLRDSAAGLRFAAKNPWCGLSLLGYSLGLLGSRGPVQVLLPFVVKNGLNAGAQAYGLIVGAYGAGAILASLVTGHLGLPRRPVLAMCLGWGFSFLGIALYSGMGAVWQGVVIGFINGAAHSYGLVIWFTMLQQRVPRNLMGRVSSVDWMMSYALVPLSLAVTGPLSSAIGPAATFVAGGIVGGIGMLATLSVPSMRQAWSPPKEPAELSTS